MEKLSKSNVEKKKEKMVYLLYPDDSTSLGEDIERILKENDIPYWEIRKDLAPGRDINDIIHDVMKERTHLVFIYSDGISLKDVESLVRIARQYDVIIIPVVTTGADLPNFLGGIKPIIYHEYDYSKLWHELLWGIGTDEDLSSEVTEPDSSVEIHQQSLDFPLIIEAGENRNVEFKLQYNSAAPFEMLETVVSFANTAGGVIIIGVDDDGNIKGIERDYSDSIQNQIIAKCDPTPDFKIGIYELEDGMKKVMYIEVSKGNNPPYMLLDHGVFVRHGSSDVQAKRSELDGLMKNKGQ